MSVKQRDSHVRPHAGNVMLATDCDGFLPSRDMAETKRITPEVALWRSWHVLLEVKVPAS
jgi:hypothetical protein